MTASGPPAAAITYATARGTARPAAVTTIATIGVILGTFGLLCKPTALAMQLFFRMPQPNPVLDVFRNDPNLRAFSVVAGLTGTLVSLLLLVSAVGSLKLAQWARLGMLCYACLAALLTLIGQVFGYLVIGPAIQQAIRQAGMPDKGPGMMGGPIGLVLGLVLGLWFPLLILFYYNRRDVKEAFALGLAKVDI